MTLQKGAQVLAVELGLPGGGGDVSVATLKDVLEVAGFEISKQQVLRLGVGKVCAHGEGLGALLGDKGDAEIFEPRRGRRKRDGALEHIAKLPDVSRPGVGHQTVEVRASDGTGRY